MDYLTLKNGNIDKGLKYYELAIIIAKSKDMKDRIRQRMNLEIGKYYYSIGNIKDSVKHLTKAIKETNGYRYAVKEGNTILKAIQ
ncbi:hypothetical protein OR1_02345 [Geobacter sp. OR-1]|uniref:hypothetical protein n=1 Tax=Geobacter sp. OR-1 TaxID=1266765 RepID=UPI0005441818|nr:hypothetical protein [Geobacter sp. OR-1]GAM10058.1 hypothetical protein OR1_02345 [Geobacter sp. OR-1]